MKPKTRHALELAAGLDTGQDCPVENHAAVVAAMEALEEEDSPPVSPPPLPKDPPSRTVPILLTGLGLAAAIGAGACLVKGHGEAAVVLGMVAIACGMRASRTPV